MMRSSSRKSYGLSTKARAVTFEGVKAAREACRGDKMVRIGYDESCRPPAIGFAGRVRTGRAGGAGRRLTGGSGGQLPPMLAIYCPVAHARRGIRGEHFGVRIDLVMAERTTSSRFIVPAAIEGGLPTSSRNAWSRRAAATALLPSRASRTT